MTVQRVALTALQRDRIDRLAARERSGSRVPTPHAPAMVLALRGSLHETALGEAVASVVDRQAALRTTVVGGTEPHQRIGPAGPLLRTVEADGANERERRAWLWRTLDDWSAREFPLGASMADIALVRLADREHALLLRADQFVADLWSLNVLATDIGVAYTAALTGERPAEPLAPGYAEVVEADNAWLTSAAGLAARADAVRRIGEITPIELPKPLAGNDSGARFGVRRFELGGVESTRLAAACRAHRATASTAVLAALGSAVARSVGVEEIPVLAVFTGRDRRETTPLVMWRAHTLPVWVPAGENTSLTARLGMVARRNFQALQGQRLPWPVVAGDLGVEPGAEAGLIAVSLQYFPRGLIARDGSGTLSGLDISSTLGTPCPTDATIDLTVSETARGIAGQCRFRQDLVAAGFVDTVLAALRAQLAEPDRA